MFVIYALALKRKLRTYQIKLDKLVRISDDFYKSEVQDLLSNYTQNLAIARS
ncbi:hypothetical protein [Komarekiella delphini-convector]|uniref:hypothetical protein n=1 Tax=Komarekiella delphini-convector TaxID=3050158 RepID=UPI00177F39CD|nr:hypothetical protein [Komarekiella delphini-convector]